MISKILISVLLIVFCGCESQETDELTTAQKCLDQVDDSNPSQANACLASIQNLTSPAANVIKCSIQFTAGGLTTTKIANAAKSLKDNSVQKEVIYIGALALTPVSLAQQAVTYCNQSGVPIFSYLAQLSLVGSQLMSVVPGYDPNSGQPPTQTQVQDALTRCSNGGFGGVCDDHAIGTAAENVGQTYCASSNANTDVCTKINQAIAASNGNPTNVALELYQQLAQ